MMQVKLENLCLSDKKVVEILSDVDTEQEIPNGEVKENINNDSYLNRIKVCENTLDTNEVKVQDMDLKTLIRESSWFKCNKCEYKSKSERSFREHEETQNFRSCKDNISGHSCENYSFLAETERKLRNHKVIEHTVKADDWNGVQYGCSICKNNIELANYFRNMTWSSKEKMTAHIKQCHEDEQVEKEHLKLSKKCQEIFSGDSPW